MLYVYLQPTFFRKTIVSFYMKKYFYLLIVQYYAKGTNVLVWNESGKSQVHTFEYICNDMGLLLFLGANCV